MRTSALVFTTLALSLAFSQVQAQTKVGPEFQITGVLGSDLSVAKLSDGGFVVVEVAVDSAGYGPVFGQRYNASWTPVGSKFQVNQHTAGNQRYTSVAALSGGGFVVTWTSYSNHEDGSGSAVYGQRYDGAGAAAGDVFRVNTYTTGDQAFSSVAGLRGGGGFVIVWTSDGQDGSGQGVYGQLYDANGKRTGREFHVNTYTADNQFSPRVAALGGGGFVVTWISTGQDGAPLGIYGQRYAADRTQVGREFPVNTPTQGRQPNQTVAGLSNGFVVTWDSLDSSNLGIFGQRYHASGTPAGGRFQVNTYTFSQQSDPSVAGLGDGGFVVTWVSFHQNDGLRGVYCQRYSAAGAPVGGEFPVSNDSNNLSDPTVLALSDGGYVVTWASGHKRHGPPSGYYGQRFGP